MPEFLKRDHARKGQSPPSAVPVATFNGYLKSCEPTKLEPTLCSQLRELFPTFFDDDERLEFRIDPDTWQPQVRRVKVRKPPRRFAGYFDQVLFPRGRYHSVARNATGDDGGALAREIFAYSRPDKQLLIADTSQEYDTLHLKKPGIQWTSPNSLVVLLEPFSWQSSASLEIPLSIQEVTIPDCVDLRRREVQEWFYQQFRNGVEQHILFTPDANIALQEFVDMLPGLIWPSLGGGGIEESSSITRAIGSWMRFNRVSALGYPSARSNIRVKYAAGEVVTYYGWNLVDYRGTWDDTNFIGPNPILMCNMSGWPPGLPYPNQIQIDKRGSGSWQLVGAKEFLLRRFDALESSSDTQS